MKAIELLNTKNNAILFVDSKVKEVIQAPTQLEQQTNNVITSQDKETVESILDYSSSIISLLNLDKMEYITSNDYKTFLEKTLIKNNIIITEGILQHLISEGYAQLEKILRGFSNFHKIIDMQRAI